MRALNHSYLARSEEQPHLGAVVHTVDISHGHMRGPWGPPAFLVAGLATHQPVRGRGLARSVMEALLADADQSGINLVLECLPEDMQNADWLMDFYGRLGFSLVDGGPVMWRPPVLHVTSEHAWRRENHCCIDCGHDTSRNRGLCEYYAVIDAVWQMAGMTPHGGMLCIGCLELRLGRRLTRRDFSEAPVNTRPPQSLRLRSRLR